MATAEVADAEAVVAAEVAPTDEEEVGPSDCSVCCSAFRLESAESDASLARPSTRWSSASSVASEVPLGRGPSSEALPFQRKRSRACWAALGLKVTV